MKTNSINNMDGNKYLSDLTKDINELISNHSTIESWEIRKMTRRVNNSFAGLPRHLINVSDLVSMKFKLQHLKRTIFKALLDRVVKLKENQLSNTSEELSVLIDCLRELNLKISREDLVPISQFATAFKLNDYCEDKIAYLLALQNQGELLKTFVSGKYYDNYKFVAGPQLDISIEPMRPSKWSWDRWSECDEFSNYYNIRDGVYFRGCFFKSGDIVIANVGLGGNGQVLASAESRNYESHSGIFAILKKGDKKFPAVIENYKHGVRAVPLSVFVGSKYSTYVEQFRPQNISDDFTSKINQYAMPLFSTGEALDINYLLEKTQVAPMRTTSECNPRVQENLDSFGIAPTAGGQLLPQDFVMDPGMKHVGTIDNNHFEKNVASELFELKFKYLIENKKIFLKRVPLKFKIGQWVNQRIQRNAPKRSIGIQGLTGTVESIMADSVLKTHPEISRLIDYKTPFEIDQFASMTSVNKLVNDNFTRVSSWFDNP